MKQVEVRDNLYCIPVFLVEDRLREVGKPFSDRERLATICYDRKDASWSVEEVESLLTSM